MRSSTATISKPTVSPSPVKKQSSTRRRARTHPQRRAALRRREPAAIIVIGALAFLGTLAITLVTAHASVTGGGYQRTDLRQAARHLEEENQGLRAKVAYLESGARIAQDAPKIGLINDRKNVKILTPQGEQ